MKLKLRINIGSVDALRLGLAPDQCQEGAVLDVKDDKADELLAKRWAELDAIKAVPSAPAMKGK